MAAYGLYTHIASNKFRSMLLLAGLFVLVYVIVYAGALIIEVFNYGGAPADHYLRVALSDVVNAYAIGLNQRHYAVAVRSGLLNALNDQEIEAVLGHELTRVRNGDVQMMVIAVIIAGVVGFFAELFFRAFFNFGNYGWGYGGGSSWSSSSSSSSDNGRGDRKSSGGGAIVIIIVAVVLIALAWALSQLVRLALSRSRELLADAGSVELTKNPDAMISALRKI